MPRRKLIVRDDQGGSAVVNRKTMFMACAIQDTYDAADVETQAKILREAVWCDLVPPSEWQVLIADDPTTVPRATRSKFKKRLAGMMMVLAHAAELDQALFHDAAVKARQMRLEQHQESMPWPEMAVALAGLRTLEPGEMARLSIRDATDDA